MITIPYAHLTRSLTLLFLLLLTACGRLPQPTPTPLAPTTTNTATAHMPTPTSIPTTQPASPTSQPTPSPTPPAEPTIAPEPPTATPPGPAEGVTYHLAEWTPARANELDAFLQTYPDTTNLETSPFWGNGDYWKLFRLPALVKLEALRRFPAAPDATNWQWSATFDLGRSDAGRYVNDYYAFLISSALNEGETTITELPAWWQQHEPRLTLTLTELQPAPGNHSNYVLFLDGFGGAYFWLTESDSGFQLFPLLDDWYFYEPSSSRLQFELNDATGDGFPEAITLEEAVFVDGPSTPATLTVFDLTQIPPREVIFRPPAPNDSIIGWNIMEQGDAGLQISSYIGVFIDCAFPVQQDYLWNGIFLELTWTHYPTLEDISNATRNDSTARCITNTANNAIRTLFWGDRGAAQWLEAPLFDELNPSDATEALRFNLGLAQAFAGNTQSAVQHLTTLVTSPTISSSQWITPAQHFLAAYQPAGQLVQACAATQLCYPLTPLAQLANLLPADTATPIDTLQFYGVPIEAAGLFDFEHDQQPEYWFFTLDVDYGYQVLSLLAQTNDGWEIVEVGSLTDSQNATIIELPVIQGIPVFKLTTSTDEQIFTFERDSAGQLLATSHRTYAQLAYQAAMNAFVLGQPAEQIRDLLLSYGQLLYEDCNSDDYLSLCSDLLYLQGLSYELSGDETNAIATYLQLWRTYPSNPYTLIIQAKLQP